MKPRSLVVHAAALILASLSAAAGQQFGGGRLVEWLPGYDSSVPVYAAVGKSVVTVVVYDPGALARLAPEYARLLLLRQDAIAYLAADELRARGEHGIAFGSPTFSGNNRSRPFEPIDEQMFYQHPKLRNAEYKGFDCVAFQALTSAEQRALRDAIVAGERQQSAGIVVLPSKRRLNAEALRFLESRECAALASAFE